MHYKILGFASAGALLAAVVGANWVTTRYGFIGVGFGLRATAGTFLAGLALALRDAIQDLIGKYAVLVVIAAAALVSYAVSAPAIAIASATAFGIAEFADFAIYTPLRRKARLGDTRWGIAVLASGVVGAIVDTAVFITIAFGAAAVGAVLLGQFVGKIWSNLGFLVVGKAVSLGGGIATRSGAAA